MNRGRLAIGAMVIAVFGVAGVWSARSLDDPGHTLELRHSSVDGLYWTCSMHPQVRLAASGGCPICGMKLLAKRKTQTAAPESVRDDRESARGVRDKEDVIVRIDPRMIQRLGVRTAPVQTGRLTVRVSVSGRVAIDERRVAAVSVRAMGWVERLHVRAAGEPVRKGQLLAEIYARDLIKAQDELIVALQVGDAELIADMREELLRWGVGEAQIAQLEAERESQRRVRIFSPVDGYVLELTALEGAQVMPETALFRLADQSQMWIIIDAPPAQAAWVGVGAKIKTHTAAQPGLSVEGVIDYVYPDLDPIAGTVRARATVLNADHGLKPGAYMEVTIEGDAPGGDVLLAPTESVIRTGTRTVVLTALGDGRFHPVEVKVGREGDRYIEIIDGLSAGVDVVTSGQFLIDSEASLHGAYARFGDPDEGTSETLAGVSTPMSDE